MFENIFFNGFILLGLVLWIIALVRSFGRQGGVSYWVLYFGVTTLVSLVIMFVGFFCLLAGWLYVHLFYDYLLLGIAVMYFLLPIKVILDLNKRAEK